MVLHGLVLRLYARIDCELASGVHEHSHGRRASSCDQWSHYGECRRSDLLFLQCTYIVVEVQREVLAKSAVLGTVPTEFCTFSSCRIRFEHSISIP